jgi:hypothetical protein
MFLPRLDLMSLALPERPRLLPRKSPNPSPNCSYVQVAAIVAETHDNMLICDRMVKCNLVPTDKVLILCVTPAKACWGTCSSGSIQSTAALFF